MKRKVAIYARVSTEHEAQLSALDNQVQYYDDILKQHKDWILYERYIDEGITGTSTKKRKNFMRMMEDAKNKKFDLIITREVSRFARNTVDTLQETRKLKKIGVEVYFTEDNIWTFNDEDGELKLTIMATLAQNESKKTSQRVKAGQMVSFKNGVFYGTGNILGYNRDGKEAVINPEQAETVKFIFSEYLNGKGTTKIAEELEKNGAITSTGLDRWNPAYITRVLRNPFYCGTIIYRKQYVPDYLEQKHKTNHGEVEKIIVEGKHEPIISKEDFKKVQDILDNHSRAIKVGMRQGVGIPKNIWSRKLRCECGSTFNRRVYHRNKSSITYSYACYNRAKHRQGRKYKEEFIPCDIKELPEWKLKLMAEFIFKALTKDSENRKELSNRLLKGVKIEDDLEQDLKNKINKLKVQVDEITSKLDKILDMYMNELVDLNSYDRYQNNLNEKIEKYNIEINELERKLESVQPYEVRLENAKNSIKKLLDIDYNGVSEQIIEEIVEYIIVHKDWYEWKLNFMNETIKMKIVGRRKEDCFVVDYIK